MEVVLHMRAVLCTPLFVLTALSLSALYYVVAALQLWVTPRTLRCDTSTLSPGLAGGEPAE